MNIRQAKREDLSTIVDIYNEAVLHTVATFDTVPRTLVQQEAWFEAHGAMYPVVVAEQQGKVVGWASLNPYSDRLAYERTAELSLYIHNEYRGQGLGQRLTAAVLEAGRLAGLHTVLSRIAEGNDSSVYIHEKFGFTHVGVMKEVGYKFGRLLDVLIMQKML